MPPLLVLVDEWKAGACHEESPAFNAVFRHRRHDGEECQAMRETGCFDMGGIPIFIGDLIRVPYYTHYLHRRKMYMYLVVGEIDGVAVVREYDEADQTKWRCRLDALDTCEVVAESGLHRDEWGEVMTFNERPRRKLDIPSAIAKEPTQTEMRV